MRDAPFTIPPDALRKLGGGSAALVHAVIHDTLGTHVMSGSLGTIGPDAVTEIGHGDYQVGLRILQKFIATVRRQRLTKEGRRSMQPVLSISIERS
jgi:hypothetical protein